MDIPTLQKYLDEKIVDFNRINEGGNNEIYKVTLPSGPRVLKSYSNVHMNNWPRGEREFLAISHLWTLGFRNIPEPFSFYDEDNIGVYSFEQGKILSPGEIKEQDVLHVSDFLVNLHSLRAVFPKASTAALYPTDYVRDVEKRISFLRPIVEESSSQVVRDLFNDRIIPKAEELIKRFREGFSRLERNSALPPTEQRLNFGDFGFHNVLVHHGSYKFIDFEYFGRDDPVRELLGFVHHDKHLDLSRDNKRLFLDNYLTKTNASNKLRNRLRQADSLKGMTWVLTYLNVLSPEYLSQQKSLGVDVETLCLERVSKAERKLNDLAFFKD